MRHNLHKLFLFQKAINSEFYFFKKNKAFLSTSMKKYFMWGVNLIYD